MPLDGSLANGSAQLVSMPESAKPDPGQAAASGGVVAPPDSADVANCRDVGGGRHARLLSAGRDVRPEVGRDAGPEASLDASADVVPGARRDAGPEARLDASPEVARGASLDASAEAGLDASGEAGLDASGEAGPDASPQPARLFADWPTWLIAATVFAAYTIISVFRYLRRDPTSWDLGIFTEYVKQYAHLRAPIVDIRGTGINLLGDHFHPIVALIAPFFRLFPSPVTLLLAQALLAALSVFPVSRAGRELLGPGTGRAIAAAYGLSWGLQQMANYDFHEIAFAVPLLAFALSELARGRWRVAAAWALPLVLVKEDQGFTVAAIGLIMMFAYRRRSLGCFLAIWGLAWSLLAILVIIPHFNALHTYAYWAEGGAISPVGGHFSLGGLWHNLSTGASTKLPTLALILVPTAFIALRSPLALAVLPGLALRFIGTNTSYWSTDWHYNATVMPIVFVAAIDAIARIRASRAAAVADASPVVGQLRAGASPTAASTEPGGPDEPWSRRRGPGRIGYAMEHYGAAAMLALCAGLAFQFPLSSLWTPATYQLGPHVAAENQAMALVPNGATVATDLDLLAPLAASTDTFWLGNYPTNPPTQYVVFDAQSTDWQPPPPNVAQFVRSLIHHARYRQIYANDGVYVFRRSG